jgi:trimeric autotransporter adhesin
MTPKKQVSPAIRILRGERDASARATHLEAATRKFLVTTIERKQMSTKTNFKRIALVAVAALGLGVLSSVPSNAAWSGTAGTSLTLTVVNGTAGLTGARSDSTTAGTFGVRGLALATNDSIAVTIVNKTKPALAVDFPTPLFMLVDTGTSTAGLVAPVGKIPTVTSGQVVAGTVDRALTRYVDTATGTTLAAVGATGYVEGNYLVYLDSSTSTTRVAGTYTYTIVATPLTIGGTTTGTAQTIDISFVVTAAANTSETVDSSKSTAFLAGTLAAATADAAVSAVATASSTAAAYLSVRTYNAASGAAGESITVSIAGAGQLFHTNTSVGGTSITVKSAGGSDGDFQIRPDGRAGTATISVSTTSTTFSNKTVNFYAKAAKTITATVGTPLLAVGANTGAVRGVAVDANGTAWTGQAYIVASSATDALVGGSATTPVACAAYDTVNARHNCPITTLTTGTAKFKIIDAATVAAATATSNEVTVTVSAALPATVKLEFDKATYAPNERARIYVTPLDSTGKAMQSAAYTSMLASGGITVIGAVSYTGTTTTADSLTAATAFTTAAQTSSTTGAKAGSMQFTVYMPAAGGTVTLSATGGSALPLAGQVAVTATATVTDSGAAALAAVNALATTVASLKTLITTLTNLVLKIQKKVKA